MPKIDEKEAIQQSIARARDGVGDRIDELDQHVRSNYDPKTLASNYAPQLALGGAVVGALLGFGLPKTFRRLVTWGVPVAIAAMAIKNGLNGTEGRGQKAEGRSETSSLASPLPD